MKLDLSNSERQTARDLLTIVSETTFTSPSINKLIEEIKQKANDRLYILAKSEEDLKLKK